MTNKADRYGYRNPEPLFELKYPTPSLGEEKCDQIMFDNAVEMGLLSKGSEVGDLTTAMKQRIFSELNGGIGHMSLL